jgi:hypothetical protein
MPRIPSNNAAGTGVYKHHKTYEYTGAEQTFVVPQGITQLIVSAHGGEGSGQYNVDLSSYPGRPGRVLALIPVQSGETLYVFVGASGDHGGYNGGGQGGPYGGSDGGGASDVRVGGDKLSNRIVVAAGGGGAAFGGSSFTTGARGGDGGGLIGGQGGRGGGFGGRQHRGGAGGTGENGGQTGMHGKVGTGGTGAAGAPPSTSHGESGFGGGGGGGGYYGGGGGGGGGPTSGGYASVGGGGGGGSSYVEKSAIKYQMWSGWRQPGDGRVVFNWN